MKKRILVIGAGAAGMIAAGRAAESAGSGAEVLLLERNDKPGRKIVITGKGRCNVTNAVSKDNPTDRAFTENIVTGGRFLYSALSRFGASELMALIEAQGVPLKIERGNRVFPVSDTSFDIVDALKSYYTKAGAKLRSGIRVTGIAGDASTGRFTVDTEQGAYEADAVIVATGGLSYPVTGSTGDGYRFAADCGHSVTRTLPSLVSFRTAEKWVRDLAGLSLKNISLTLWAGEKKIYDDFGEMLFTHLGISGPTVLSASAAAAQHLRKTGLEIGDAKLRVVLDLKPALTAEELDARLQRELRENPLRQLKTVVGTLLPSGMVPVCLKLTGLNGEKKSAEVSREERLALGKWLKELPFTVIGTGGYEEAVITTGGIETKEINPKTMESKLVPGLFFAGEVLDIDALTGGFNLQLAFSTGYAAGEAAAEFINQ